MSSRGPGETESHLKENWDFRTYGPSVDDVDLCQPFAVSSLGGDLLKIC